MTGAQKKRVHKRNKLVRTFENLLDSGVKAAMVKMFKQA
jgi:hypothetical protein